MNPFKRDDDVYHYYHGKVKLTRINGDHVWYACENNGIVECKEHYSAFSFDEWEKPNHVRKIPVGWYVCRFPGDNAIQGNDLKVLWRGILGWYWNNGQGHLPIETEIEIIRQITPTIDIKVVV